METTQMLRSLTCSLFLGFAIIAGGSSVAFAQSPDGGGRRKQSRSNTSKPEKKPQQKPQKEREGYLRISEVSPLLAYRIKFVDIPLVSKEMQLDKGQQDILEQIVLDYQVKLDTERAALLEQLMNIEEAKLGDDPDWEQRRSQRKRVMGRPEGRTRDQSYSRARDSMRGELSASLEVPPLSSRRTNLLRQWQSMHDEEWETLLGSIDVIRNPDQPGHWEAIARALRRRHTPWQPQLRGEGVDLAQIILSYWGKDHPVLDIIHAEVMAYAMEYDDALLARDEIMALTMPTMLDSRVYAHPGPYLRSINRQVDARARMVDVNSSHIEPIASALPPEDSARFRRLALRKMYPGIYESHQVDHLVDFLQSHAAELNLDESQLVAIGVIYQRYRQELQPLQRSRAASAKALDSRRIVEGEEQQAMQMCYGVMASLNPEEDQVFDTRKQQMDEYNQITFKYMKELKDLITQPVYESLPGYAVRSGRGNARQGPVKDSDPDAPIIYLRGPGDNLTHVLSEEDIRREQERKDGRAP